MVCPVCLIPIVTGTTALGSGTAISSTKNTIIIIILILITIISIALTVYFITNKKKLKSKCDSCKIPKS